MRYFKIRKVVTDYTTLSLVTSENEQAYKYAEDGEYEYWGANTDDQNFLTKQHTECEVEELTFAQIQPVLENCKMMKDLNKMISDKIHKQYSLDDEIAILQKSENHPDRLVYNDFRADVKLEVNNLKQQFGLIE